MFCSNCGVKLNDNDIFCSSCGAETNCSVQAQTKNLNNSNFSKKDFDFVMRIKPFMIAAFILMITNPVFSALNLFNIYNPFTQEKVDYETVSLMSLVFELGEEVPFFIVAAILGIILLIISALIMIIPLIKKKIKPVPKHFIPAKIMSVVALLANLGVIIMIFFELNEGSYSDFVKLSPGGIINIIACIALVVAVFATASKVKKVRRLENENEIYYSNQ